MWFQLSDPNQSSGARLFNVATQFRDLSSQLIGSRLIPARDCHGQCKFKLFQLMAAFKKPAGISQ